MKKNPISNSQLSPYMEYSSTLLILHSPLIKIHHIRLISDTTIYWLSTSASLNQLCWCVCSSALHLHREKMLLLLLLHEATFSLILFLSMVDCSETVHTPHWMIIQTRHLTYTLFSLHVGNNMVLNCLWNEVCKCKNKQKTNWPWKHIHPCTKQKNSLWLLWVDVVTNSSSF